MSITIVVRRRARPGQEEALLAGMLAVGAQRHSLLNPQVRVLQGLRDRRGLLYIGEWRSRESYERSDQSGLAALAALSEGPPERWYLQQLDVRESSGERAQAITATLVRAPPAATAAVIRLLLEEIGAAVCRSPGFLLRALYQDLDDPGRLLALNGWRSAADLLVTRRMLFASFAAPLTRLGATSDLFEGDVRGTIDRAEPTGPPAIGPSPGTRP